MLALYSGKNNTVKEGPMKCILVILLFWKKPFSASFGVIFFVLWNQEVGWGGDAKSMPLSGKVSSGKLCSQF